MVDWQGVEKNWEAVSGEAERNTSVYQSCVPGAHQSVQNVCSDSDLFATLLEVKNCVLFICSFF